jgi:hypothetical protein
MHTEDASMQRLTELTTELAGALSDEELAAALAAEDDAALARQMQEQEDSAHLQLRLEQERSDLAYAASFADTWERQRTRYLEQYTGTKVRTMGYHEHALDADREPSPVEEDVREPDFDDYCEVKALKQFNPQTGNVRLATRIEKKRRNQVALKFTPVAAGQGVAAQVPRKVS